jgi:hypothetical protein
VSDLVNVLKRAFGITNASHFTATTAWAPINASVPTLAWYLPSFASCDLIDGLTHVTRMYDLSGHGDANRDQVRAAVGQEPNYSNADADYGGKPSISSDGVRGLLTVGAWSAAPTPPLTMLVVGKCAANAAYLSGRNAAGNLLWQFGNNVQFYNGPALSLAQLANTPGVMMFEDDGTASGTAARIFLNDLTNPVASGATCASADTGYNVITGDAGVGPLNGSEAEIIFWSGILSPADKAKLVTYLNVTRAYGLPVV